MSDRKIPRDLELGRALDRLADELKWNLSEQYVADGANGVLKGGNEVVSLYVRGSAEENAEIANGLEKIIGPIRRQKVLSLLDQIDALSLEIRLEQQ